MTSSGCAAIATLAVMPCGDRDANWHWGRVNKVALTSAKLIAVNVLFEAVRAKTRPEQWTRDEAPPWPVECAIDYANEHCSPARVLFVLPSKAMPLHALFCCCHPLGRRTRRPNDTFVVLEHGPWQ